MLNNLEFLVEKNENIFRKIVSASGGNSTGDSEQVRDHGVPQIQLADLFWSSGGQHGAMVRVEHPVCSGYFPVVLQHCRGPGSPGENRTSED